MYFIIFTEGVQAAHAVEQPSVFTTADGGIIKTGEENILTDADGNVQQLLQEAGIQLGEGGVLQTIDGQVLSGKDGTPIRTNNKASLPPVKQNNLVGNAAAAAVLDTADIDIPLSASQVMTELQPNLPIANSSYGTVSPAPIQERSIAPKQRRPAGLPNTDLQIGPDQQKVTYTVTSENGYTQTDMMICSNSGIPIMNDEISEEVRKEETTEDQGQDQGEKPSHQISPEADSSPETVKDLDKTIEKDSEVGIPILIDEVVAKEDGESVCQNPPKEDGEEVGGKPPVWTVSERQSFFGFSDSDDE